MLRISLIICCLFIFHGCVTSYKKTIYTQMSYDKMLFYPVILFDSGLAEIKPESFSQIERIYKILNEYPYLNLSIEGHTDNEGVPEFNYFLSEKRAISVKDELVKLGIDPKRLKTRGWGSSKPVISNDSQENKFRNRRVEFVQF